MAFTTYSFAFLSASSFARLSNSLTIKIAANKEKQKAKQNAKLKISNKQKDEIISAISHEFKNPIAIISGYTETILNDEEMPQAIKIRFLKKIYSNANKMSSIVDKLSTDITYKDKKEICDILLIKKIR